MSNAPLYLNDLAHLLQREFTTNTYPKTEQGGIYQPSNRAVKRLGMALEPSPTLMEWVVNNQIDALWLHRPWKLDLSSLPANVGVVSHHLPFDETLTMGYNRVLAKQLSTLGDPIPFAYKPHPLEPGQAPLPARPIGMFIDVAPREFDYWLEIIKTMFDGYDRAEAGFGTGDWQPTSYRIAVVGAMTDALVREAAEQGANLYLTGAYRKPGQQAVDETGMAVIAVGHRRSEEWGLRALADLLRDQLPIECVLHEQPVFLH